MQTLTEIRTLLEEWGLSPKHKLGQNFLVDHNLITKLVDASGVQTGDLVLEVGPGTGTMTPECRDDELPGRLLMTACPAPFQTVVPSV